VAEGDHCQMMEPTASYNVEMDMKMAALSDDTVDY